MLSSPENSQILLYHPTEKNSGGVVTTPSTLGDLGDVWKSEEVSFSTAASGRAACAGAGDSYETEVERV